MRNLAWLLLAIGGALIAGFFFQYIACVDPNMQKLCIMENME